MPKQIDAPENQLGHLVNNEFTEPYHGPSEIIQEPQVDVTKPAYSLEEADYYKIVKGDNAATRYTWEFFIISAGYIVLLAAKYLGNAKIEKWEPIAPIIAIGLFLILHFLTDRFLPSDKKKVLRKIKNFFKAYPSSFEPHHKKR